MAVTLKKIGIYSLLIAVLGFVLYLWICSFTYSKGSRSGHLVKLAKKGFVFKTFEAQLNLGGVQVENGLEGNMWEFSIINKELIPIFETLEGKKVKVYYKERYKSMPWLAKTNYIAYKVESL
ncbi:MAG: 6-phosphogluconate dehydrogenase [Flavobacteriaceae bacterium]|nr:6-phosphogluconate dehydrogenase [Flavobacteriaceae bacterium]